MSKHQRNIVFTIFIGLSLMIVSCTGGFNKNEPVNPLASTHQNIPTVIHVTEAGGVDDSSFNASTWLGINHFYTQYGGSEGKEFRFITTPTLAQMENNLSIATDEEPTLVIAAGFNFIESLEKVARQNPNQYYLLIDGPDYELDNVKSTYFADEQSAFLVGVLAALKSQEDGVEDPVFGFIGGMPGGVITRFEMGFLQGIKHVLGNETQIVSYYANDWANPSAAKTIASQWINQFPSLYAIFSAAGPTGNGTIAQLKESYREGRIVWALGVDSDQYFEGLVSNDGQSVVLSSALKNAHTVAYDTLEQLYNGNFDAGQHVYDLKNSGVGVSFTNSNALSSELLSAVKEIKEQIKSNQITVASTRAEVQAMGLLQNYQSDAKDD